MSNHEQSLQAGMQHHQAGRLAEAEAIYRQILAQQPQHAEALHLLGVIAGQVGRPDVAIELIRRAIAIQPGDSTFYNNLGKFLMDKGNFDEAIAVLRSAVEINPYDADAINNLGFAMNALGRFGEAIAALREAIRVNPNLVSAYNNLGIALKGQGLLEEAIAAYREALRLNPSSAESHANLGNALQMMNQWDEAEAAYRQSIALNPAIAQAHFNLGIVLNARGESKEAIDSYRRATQLKPDFAEAFSNLANILASCGEGDEAEAACREALRINPKNAEAHGVLGNVLKSQGRVQEAVASYRTAISLAPNAPGPHSNLLVTLNYLPESTAQTLFEEARSWGARHADPFTTLSHPHENERSFDRRLRVGFVSSDFIDHPSAVFFEPLLRARDREKMEVFCYAQVACPDEVTERLRTLADHWRSTIGLSDEGMAQRIREDRIDVLVNLNLHFGDNRLLVFARRPAPVQVAWLAYPGITGMRAMTYRLTDPFLDPPATARKTDSEDPIWMPDSFWCYGAPQNAPAVSLLPAISAGHVTFGCFNNFCKVSQPALETWCKILVALPTARLILHAPSGSPRERVHALFEQRGVDRGRVEFIGYSAKFDYFKNYQSIDLGLDPFPCAGGTTTCDALWMGVPVITLAGETPISRSGVSILSNAWLTDFITRSESEYVNKAVSVANDLPRLAKIRVALRDQMKVSNLMDAPRFTRAMERAFRDMWHRWCKYA